MQCATRYRRLAWAWLITAVASAMAVGVGCQRTPAPRLHDDPDTPATKAAPGVDPTYIHWLQERSMLFQARQPAAQISGNGVQWRHVYGQPQSREAVQRASVWLLDYAGSVIPRPGRSVIATWADPALWDALQKVGIDLLHTGPVSRAGGIRGREYTSSIDGWFDPISLELDPQLGTEAEYQRLVEVAARHRGLIAGDLVPLHTGMGADFRLALMAYQDYPGMYTMVEIAPQDWSLLPKVDDPEATAPVSRAIVEQLRKKGYLPGSINNNDAVPNARDLSGWAASGPIHGADGKVRRWVYLHYFKPGQPTLNWLDPSYAAPRALAGDIAHQLHDRGARVLRLDAVPFLGIEPVPGKEMSLHYQHPLSVNATSQLAMLIRKLGGWSFHELNVPLSELKKFTQNGPDFSYDFFTRAQCLHAVLTEDAAPLRQSFQFLQEAGVEPLTLVHDLQNHDEITYQLVELDHRKDATFTIHGRKVTGEALREEMLQAMRARAAGARAPHNRLYRPEKDGVATSYAAFVAASLNIRDPYQATAEQVAQIKGGHLLLALANAMQPGVFSLSSWDLVGALPVPEKAVAPLVGDGDYRWMNRGGVDLMGANPTATRSAIGLPRAKALYGALPEQLKDPESFASHLRRMLAARTKYRIAEGKLIAVPDVKERRVCLLVMQVPEGGVAITALNFGSKEVAEDLDLAGIREVQLASVHGQPVVDAITGTAQGTVAQSGRLEIKLAARTGKTLVIRHTP